ncbi:MAG: 16S rRNA (adenine(1518)-N(6)/adenine(1519)-N(6))-dimethyltransferase RsmA [Candidatus Rifleibacteriota bacterium]
MISNNKQPIKAKKSLGQNFCIDDRIPAEMVQLLDASSQNEIWEIGPGTGKLTEKLAETEADLTLFEIDKRMKPFLEEQFPQANIIWSDFLKVSSTNLPDAKGPLLICGNLPYYCGTAIIKKILESGPQAEKLVFLLQEEVAKKAAAKVNDKDYSYISVFVKLFAESSTGSVFSPASFAPQPKVNSQILILEPLKLDQQQKNNRLTVLKKISLLFSQRRKMVLPLLKKKFNNIDWQARFAKLKIEEKARPQNIPAELFLHLFSD